MFKSKRAKQGSQGGRPKNESQADEDEEVKLEAERAKRRDQQAERRNQVCY